MAFLDDARHSGTDVHSAKPWPREFLTLTLVSVCVAFWTVVLLASGAI
jgi:hypothetical protein